MFSQLTLHFFILTTLPWDLYIMTLFTLNWDKYTLTLSSLWYLVISKWIMLFYLNIYLPKWTQPNMMNDKNKGHTISTLIHSLNYFCSAAFHFWLMKLLYYTYIILLLYSPTHLTYLTLTFQHKITAQFQIPLIKRKKNLKTYEIVGRCKGGSLEETLMYKFSPYNKFGFSFFLSLKNSPSQFLSNWKLVEQVFWSTKTKTKAWFSVFCWEKSNLL